VAFDLISNTITAVQHCWNIELRVKILKSSGHDNLNPKKWPEPKCGYGIFKCSHYINFIVSAQFSLAGKSILGKII
jgi:hypothetical protein